MKDENNGVIMIEFIGFRAKMYALRVEGKKDTKQDVKSNVVARSINSKITRDVWMMQSKWRAGSRSNCTMYTISETKIALNRPHDNKR